MARVITFSRTFPAYHPQAGRPTFFAEAFYNSIGLKIGVTKQSGDIPEAMWPLVNDFVLLDGTHKKHHTIRAGNRWKAGDKFSPRVWSGKPYNSKQIILAPDMEILKVWSIEILNWANILIDGKLTCFDAERKLHHNDGLSWLELTQWFKKLPFTGQIICWSNEVAY